MTDKQLALPQFERTHVDKAEVRITKAGDGLSEALKVAPKALRLGDEVFYVLRGKVTQVNHRQREKDDETATVRLHTVEAQAITEIDSELADKLLTAAAEEIARAQAEAEGQGTLGDEDGE